MNRSIGSIPVVSLLSVSQAATVYSDPVLFERTTGEIAALVISTAGSVTVTTEYSDDKMNWYGAVDSANSAIGAVCATMTVGSRWVKVTPSIGRWIRFKIVENNSAATVVSIRLMSQEEN